MLYKATSHFYLGRSKLFLRLTHSFRFISSYGRQSLFHRGSNGTTSRIVHLTLDTVVDLTCCSSVSLCNRMWYVWYSSISLIQTCTVVTNLFWLTWLVPWSTCQKRIQTLSLSRGIRDTFIARNIFIDWINTVLSTWEILLTRFRHSGAIISIKALASCFPA